MQFRKIIYSVIGHIVMLFFLTSCQEEKPYCSDALMFAVETKADDMVSEPTYRVVAYYGSVVANQMYRYVSSGTYILKSGDQFLSPCVLNDAGEYVTDNKYSALDGMSTGYNPYSLVLVSPGRKINSDGSFDFSPDNDNDKLILNDPAPYTLGGYGTMVFTNPLHDPRSEIVVMVYKSKSGQVEDFTVTDAYLRSVNQKDEGVSIYPSTCQVKVNDINILRSLDLIEEPDKKEDQKGLLYYKSSPVVIASGYYAPKNIIADILGMNTNAQSYLVESNYVFFECKISQGNRAAVPIRIPLNAIEPLLLPQKVYVYRIIVSSNYISLKVDVFNGDSNNWQDGGNFDDEKVAVPDYSYTVGTWDFNDWVDVEGDLSQTI